MGAQLGSDPATPYAVPAPGGKITQWQTNTAGDTAGKPLELIVLSPNGNGAYTVVAVDAESVPNPLPAGGIATFTPPTPLTVGAGDVLGLYVLSGNENCAWSGGSIPADDVLGSFISASAPAPGQSLAPAASVTNYLVDVAATLVPPRTLTVTEAGSGVGTVSSTPAGIDCGATCSAKLDEGTAVMLTAIAAAGSRFVGWSGGGCSGTSTCTVTMSSDQSVTATFTAVPPSPPNTKIARAKIKSSKAKATFNFKATGGSTGFQCALVSKKHKKAKFKSCRSPKTYKKLKPGKYVFEVRAVGPGGTDPSPAKKTFRIG